MVKAKAQRSTAEIQAELAQSRTRLAAEVEGLVDELNPKNVAKRAVDDAKTLVVNEYEAAKAQLKDEEGWRVDRLVMLGGAILGVLAFFGTLKSIIGAVKRRRA